MSPRSRRAIGPVGFLWLSVTALFLTGWAWLAVNLVSQAPELPIGHVRAAAFYLIALVVLALLAGSGDSAVLVASAWALTGLGLLARLRLAGADLPWPTLRADWSLPLGTAALLLGVLLFRNGRAELLRVLWLVSGLLAITVLIGMLAVGRRFRGGVYLAGLTNPTEVAKLLLPICCAGILSAKWANVGKRWWPSLSPSAALALAVFGVGPLLLLALLRDFGFALLWTVTLVVMFALATERTEHALLGLLLAVAGAVALFHWVPHARIRWEIWRDPFRDEAGRGWQSLQGLAALYHGRLWGRGLGAGFPHLVPIASSDFVYAVWGEEIGFVGCGLMLLLYVLLLSAGLRVAGAQSDGFARLLAGGLTTMLAAQTLVHVAGVTKAMPLTGVPLPFISHGGSSLAVSLAAVGLLAALASGSGASRAPRVKRKTSKGGSRK